MEEQKRKRKKSKLHSIRDLLSDFRAKSTREAKQLSYLNDAAVVAKYQKLRQKKKYMKHDHQQYGIFLAYRLNDPDHKTLYIKLARDIDRPLLEKCFQFAVDYPNMENKNRGKLFMWKLKMLKAEHQGNEKSSKAGND